MITEIIIGKKYKGLWDEYIRTPLCVHPPYVFYEHNWKGFNDCTFCRIDEFKKFVEEIPEAPEEWFSVIYKTKGENTRPYLSNFLYRSKEDFLNHHVAKESDYEFIKLKKVEL